MIIFDFDGVLVDSAPEMPLTTYNTITGSKLTRLEDLPPGFYDLFNHNRHLTLAPPRTISLGYWVLKTLEAGDSINSFLPREEFLLNHFNENAPKKPVDYFACRQWLIDEHLEDWLALNKPFEKIWQAAQRLDATSFFILTYKNRVAVKKICELYKLDIMDSRLFTGEKGLSKHQNILELDKLTPSDTKYIFLDDTIENLPGLAPVLPGRISPVLAIWGYNCDEDRQTAKTHGYELASETGFISNNKFFN